MRRTRGTDMNDRRNPRENGFSLIEVMVSLGLLAGVMVAVSSLFIFGGRQVQSGKKMTEAYSVGHDIMEEIERMTYQQAYMYFLPAGGDPTVLTNYTVDTKTAGNNATAFQPYIDGKLHNGVASIKAEGLDVAGVLTTLDTSVALRITVTVEWDEGTRHRYLHLRSVRF
ncbi:MAG: type II secretion system protein [Acidobacteriota bacterium]